MRRQVCWVWRSATRMRRSVELLCARRMHAGDDRHWSPRAHDRAVLREPGEQDVRADAVLEAVEDGAQLDGGLQVAEAAFGFEQVLVAERDVLGAEVGV